MDGAEYPLACFFLLRQAIEGIIWLQAWKGYHGKKTT